MVRTHMSMGGLPRSFRASAVLGALLLLAMHPPAAARQESRITVLLDAYAAGRFHEVEEHLGNVTDVPAFARAYEQQARSWVTSADSPRRRAVAAALALEIAAAHLHEWNDVRHLVEFGCELYRRSPAMRDREHPWQLASVALLLGAYDPMNLLSPRSAVLSTMRPTGHLEHAIKRFPAEERFALAILVTVEFRSWDRGYAVRDLQRELLKLSAHPTLGEEAELRLAVTESRLGEPAARARFERVAERSTESDLRYLANHFLGRMAEQQQQPAAAIERYRRALTDVPHAQSASLLLAQLLFLEGNRREAAALTEKMLTQPPQDPWRRYLAGDYRRWAALRAALRSAATQ